MCRRLARLAPLAAAALALRPATAEAQILFLGGGTNLTTPPIAEAEYDPPSVSGPTSTLTVYAWCLGGNNTCAMRLGYGGNGQGAPMQIQVQVTSASAACAGAPPAGSWTDLTSGALFTTRRNQLCIARLSFRVASLSYASYPYPGRLGTSNPYQQDVILNFTGQ